MRALILLAVVATPLAAVADVVRLADGQVISGAIRSCQRGEVVVEPPAATPVVVKVADVTSGEGPDIERCLGGRKGGPEAARGHWYGPQILVAEGSSLLLLLLGAGTRSSALAGVAVAGIVLSPAVVHTAHGNPGKALGSLGVHLGLGLAGGLIGAALAPCDDDVCFLQSAAGAGLGILASQLVASAIDVWTFAYEQPPSQIAVGFLVRDPAPDRSRPRAVPAGILLSVRF